MAPASQQPLNAVAIVVGACCLLVVATTVLHDGVLRALGRVLPALPVPNGARLVVVILGAFVAHAVEMALYGGALYALIAWAGAGSLSGGFSLANCMYFSAESYTSLGFGDLTPLGPVRMLAGVEALNGLLLIGWTASFVYLSMERFWQAPPALPAPRRQASPGGRDRRQNPRP